MYLIIWLITPRPRYNYTRRSNTKCMSCISFNWTWKRQKDSMRFLLISASILSHYYMLISSLCQPCLSLVLSWIFTLKKLLAVFRLPKIQICSLPSFPLYPMFNLLSFMIKATCLTITPMTMLLLLLFKSHVLPSSKSYQISKTFPSLTKELTLL